MKNAAKPSGVLPRTSVEKNCLNASLAITSMGLDADGAAPGETRALIDSSGTLVAANIRAVAAPSGAFVACAVPAVCQMCRKNGSPRQQGKRCSAAAQSAEIV